MQARLGSPAGRWRASEGSGGWGFGYFVLRIFLEKSAWCYWPWLSEPCSHWPWELLLGFHSVHTEPGVVNARINLSPEF